MDRNQPQEKGSFGKAPKQKGRPVRPESGSDPASGRGTAAATSATSQASGAARVQIYGAPSTSTNNAQWYIGEPIQQQNPLRYAPYLRPRAFVLPMIRNAPLTAGYAGYRVTGPVMPSPYDAGLWQPFSSANGMQFGARQLYGPPVMSSPEAFRYAVNARQAALQQQPSSYPHPSRPDPVATPAPSQPHQ